MSNMSTFHLPNEILIDIFGHIVDIQDDRNNTLKSLRLTNKLFCELSTPLLYQKICLVKGQQRSEQQMAGLLLSKLAKHVRELTLTPHAMMPYAWATAKCPEFQEGMMDKTLPYNQRYRVKNPDRVKWGGRFMRSFSAFIKRCQSRLTSLRVLASDHLIDSATYWEQACIKAVQVMLLNYRFEALKKVELQVESAVHLEPLRLKPLNPTQRMTDWPGWLDITVLKFDTMHLPGPDGKFEFDPLVFRDPLEDSFGINWDDTELASPLRKLDEFSIQIVANKFSARRSGQSLNRWMTAQLVGRMEGLSRLRVHFRREKQDDGERLRFYPLCQINCDKLRVLDFAHVEVFREAMIAFFKRCQVLEELKLAQVSIFNFDGDYNPKWAGVFRIWGKECTSLASIRLERLCYRTEFIHRLYNPPVIPGFDWPRPLDSRDQEDYNALSFMCRTLTKRRQDKGLPVDEYLEFCSSESCMEVFTQDMHDAAVRQAMTEHVRE